MKKWEDLKNWQERFCAMPCVYWVEQASLYVHGRDYTPTGNYYQTLDGANREKAWIESQGYKARIRSAHLHSDALSTERWVSPLQLYTPVKPYKEKL